MGEDAHMAPSSHFELRCLDKFLNAGIIRHFDFCPGMLLKCTKLMGFRANDFMMETFLCCCFLVELAMKYILLKRYTVQSQCYFLFQSVPLKSGFLNLRRLEQTDCRICSRLILVSDWIRKMKNLICVSE